MSVTMCMTLTPINSNIFSPRKVVRIVNATDPEAAEVVSSTEVPG